MTNINAIRDDNNVPVALGIDTATGFSRPLQVDSQGRLLISATTSSSLVPARFTIPLVNGANSISTSVLGGAGAAATITSNYKTVLATNTTSNAGIRAAYLMAGVKTSNALYDLNPELQVFAKLADTTAGGNFVSFIACAQDTSPATSTGVLTSLHFGFMAIGTHMYTTMSDGSVQTLTDIGVDSRWAVTDFNMFRVIVTTASATPTAKFYINSTLVNSLSDNLPVHDWSTNVAMTASIQNDSGVTTNRSMTIGNASILLNAE